LLEFLRWKPKLSDDDFLALVYYLLLQDFIVEAKRQFARISVPKDEAKKENVEQPSRLQYDYVAAFLDFYSDEPILAIAIAKKYQNYPILRWRSLFQELARQLQEIKDNEEVDEDEEARTKRLESLLPKLDFEADQHNKIKISSNNVAECVVRFYKMDIEQLFSSNPFVQTNLGHFSSVMPNLSQVIQLKTNLTVIDLPTECQNTNVMIEITGGRGLSKVKPHFSHNIFARVDEGLIRVCANSDGHPLSKCYIKVFAKLNDGSIIFYKDGYTDLRGVFDFESLSVDASQYISLYSVLVISEKNGTTILEAKNRALQPASAHPTIARSAPTGGPNKKSAMSRAPDFYRK